MLATDMETSGTETEEKPEKPAAGAPPAPKKPHLTEEQIDSPNRTTLVMLFVIFAVTVGSWGSARFACNMHPPESRPPPPTGTERLALTPKDAAIEVQQRWATHDYKAALELAVGEVASALQKAADACQKRPKECAVEKNEASSAMTTAVVTSLNPVSSEVTTTTVFKDKEKKTVFKYRMVRDPNSVIWKAEQRSTP